MPKIDIDRLRSVALNPDKFLAFEREVEESIRQEHGYRIQEIDETKRAQEKRARKKRLRKLRSTQAQ